MDEVPGGAEGQPVARHSDRSLKGFTVLGPAYPGLEAARETSAVPLLLKVAERDRTARYDTANRQRVKGQRQKNVTASSGYPTTVGGSVGF